jgi:hypothetical protein
MRRFFLLALLGFSFASLAAAQRVYQIDLRGNARLLSRDRPVHKGRLALFHRHADGVFLSVPEQEIVQVTETELGNLPSKALLPGEAIDVGPTGGNDRFQETAPGPGTASTPYGPMTSGYNGYGGPPRSGPGAGVGGFAPAPPLAGPNGFPISPGAMPSVIQPNGFQTMAPMRGRQ